MTHKDQFHRLGRLSIALTIAAITIAVGLLAGFAAEPVAADRASPTEPVRVRQNAKTLSADQRRRFVNAVKGLKEIPSPHDPSVNAYDFYVHLHFETYLHHDSGAHKAPVFLPWHRRLLWIFESDLRSIDPTVTVPYWDWAVDHDPAGFLWADDFLGPEGDPDDRWIVKSGPFRQGEWRLAVIDENAIDQDGTIDALQRHFGVPYPVGEESLPTQADVEAALAVPDYDAAPWNESSDIHRSFRNYFEGTRFDDTGERTNDQLHNRVHDWIGGPMSARASPGDPVFWLVHANVDRIWAEWSRRHGPRYQPVSGGPHGSNLRDNLWRIGLTPADMLDHRAMGYRYDTEFAATGPGGK